MKLPKEMKRHCPFCNSHQLHTLKQVKPKGRSKSSFNQADRYRQEKLNKGYGGSPYVIIANGKKYGAKSSKKIMIKYTCGICKKAHQSKNPQRSKKFELI
ncbi:MAG: 50S ribosomal protein L44e [DPANN group archaeon]|nr:50S ribosomal protein L44e [DPANN group archaeon]